MRQIAATRRRDRLLQQIASCDVKIFVAAICRTNSNWFEFVRQNKRKQPCRGVCTLLRQVAATNKSTNDSLRRRQPITAGIDIDGLNKGFVTPSGCNAG